MFILVGALLTLPLLAGGIGTLTGQLLAGASSVLLIGPGVLYWIAANALGAHRPSGAILARRAAAAHLASILLTLMLALAAGGINGFAGVMFIPAIVGMFFVPALIAFLAQTRTALAAAHTFGQTGRAFEPLPMAKIAQPIEPDPPNPD